MSERPSESSSRPPNLGGPATDERLRRRFPALSRLLSVRKGSIPYIQQLETADCGVACLAMVLAHHGRRISLEELRSRFGTGRDGATALDILREARTHEMHGRGVKIEADDVQHLPSASILHWEFNHFVVFERWTAKYVYIVDPRHGRRKISQAAFRQSFTGVTLVLEPTATFEFSGRGGHRIRNYLRQLLVQRHLVSKVLLSSILLRLLGLALPIVTALVVDTVVPRGDAELLMVVSAGLLAVLTFQLTSTLIRAHLLLQLRTNLDVRLTLGFLGHLADLPYAFFQRRSAGDLMLRVASNSTIRDLLTSNTLSALLDGSLVTSYLALIFLMHPNMGALALGLGTLQILVFALSRKRVVELTSEGLEAQARAQSYMAQMLAGIESLKVAGAEQNAVGAWSNLFVDELNVALRRDRVQAVVDAVMNLLQIGSPLVMVTVGTAEVLAGRLSLGSMLAINAMAIGFLAPLSSLVTSSMELLRLGSYIERIDDVLGTKPEQDVTKVAQPPRLTGQIRVRGASFAYNRRASNVVRDVSLDVEPGRAIAIVGKSGSGKTTLANLLLGLYQPTEGSIWYDDRNLAHLRLRDLRRQLGIVPQNPFIFGCSIRDNIALTHPDVGIDEIVNAARLAVIHDEIMAMPMGYETIVADGGSSLSGGQRQRLAIARALVRQPSIILLDEATSSLDYETEKRVMDNLEALRCVRIIIAHRLSTITFADEIIVMQNGHVAERGSHEELVKAGGAYRSLVATQPRL